MEEARSCDGRYWHRPLHVLDSPIRRERKTSGQPFLFSALPARCSLLFPKMLFPHPLLQVFAPPRERSEENEEEHDDIEKREGERKQNVESRCTPVFTYSPPPPHTHTDSQTYTDNHDCFTLQSLGPRSPTPFKSQMSLGATLDGTHSSPEVFFFFLAISRFPLSFVSIVRSVLASRAHSLAILNSPVAPWAHHSLL